MNEQIAVRAQRVTKDLTDTLGMSEPGEAISESSLFRNEINEGVGKAPTWPPPSKQPDGDIGS
jgi:hypothetical protein